MVDKPSPHLRPPLRSASEKAHWLSRQTSRPSRPKLRSQKALLVFGQCQARDGHAYSSLLSACMRHNLCGTSPSRSHQRLPGPKKSLGKWLRHCVDLSPRCHRLTCDKLSRLALCSQQCDVQCCMCLLALQEHQQLFRQDLVCMRSHVSRVEPARAQRSISSVRRLQQRNTDKYSSSGKQPYIPGSVLMKVWSYAAQ